MPKNGQFLDVLDDFQNLLTKNEDERNTAFEALLGADPSNPEEFRKAITDHKEFWNDCNPGLINFIPSRKFRTEESYLQSKTFLDPDDPITFQQIHQLAAKQRVKLGLVKSDTETLVAILKNNPDECRAYLASKPDIFSDLSQTSGWQPDVTLAPVPPVTVGKKGNKSTNILSDIAIGEVKNEASQLLLLQLINGSEDQQLLNNLLSAGTKPAVEGAANALGFPTEGNGLLSHPLSLEISTALNDRITELKEKAAKSGFEGFVNSLSDKQLLDFGEHLEKDNPGFKAGLPAPFKTDMADTDLDWAKGVLGVKHLQVALASKEGDIRPIIEALKTKDEGELKTKLKTLMGNHDYIDHSVTKENLGPIKKAMFQNVVNRMTNPGQLKALDETKSLAKFQEALGRLGITPNDWVKDSDLQDMKQWIRSRQLELQVRDVSQLGSTVHSKLFSVFKDLPVDKQREILEKPETLRDILNAKEKHIAEHYLGKDAKGIDELVAENTRLSAFREIHNSEIARILANFKPDITLSGDQVNEINKALHEVKASDHPDTFTDAREYKSLIDKIKDQVGAVDTGQFYKEFNLKRDGSGFTSNTETVDKIEEQHEFNKRLMDEYSKPKNSKYEKILDVFLTLNKDHPLNKKALSIDPTNSLTNGIVKKLLASKNPEEFIGSLIKINLPNIELTEEQKSLKKAMELEFTPAMFREMKNIARQRNFLSDKVANVVNALEVVQGRLLGIQENHKPITDSKEKLKFINDIDPVHLYNPSFQGTAKSKAVEMRDRYQEMTKDTALTIDQLRRQAIDLESYLANLPDDNQFNAPLSLEQKELIKQLRTDLEKELKAVREDLKFYENVQKNLGKILEAVDVAAKGKQHYFYNPEGVTRHPPISPDEISTLPKLSGTPSISPHTSVTTHSTGTIKDYLLGERVPEGKIQPVDVSHKTKTQDGRSIEYVGRYTADPNAPSQVTSKKGEISKVPGGKYEVLQFPNQDPPPQTREEQIALAEARVKFAMTMAIDILSNLDAPPSKDKPLVLRGSNPEELNYLYTAFVVLGENNPKLKFGKDAIEVNSAVFNPDHEKGRLWGFKGDSLYSSVFTNKNLTSVSTIVDNKIKHMQTITEEKFGGIKERKKVDSKVEELTEKQSQMKKALQSVHKTTEETIKQEGPAPETPSKKGSGMHS